jgi:DNA-binding NtrC family response regulator
MSPSTLLVDVTGMSAAVGAIHATLSQLGNCCAVDASRLREEDFASRHVVVVLADRESGRLRRIAELCRVPVLLISETLPDVDALDLADDFAVWPLDVEELRLRLRRLTSGRHELDEVKARLAAEFGSAQFIGKDPRFLAVARTLPKIAMANQPVLITGDTGTGKELCARAIHHQGKRRDRVFMPVDCAALPDHLFENEVFGHARGAYTDAGNAQKGLAALAEGGTLFLDEIDALSVTAQAKLLRFIQERMYRPLGAEQYTRADVNVIAASNKDLEAYIRESRFRQDLYFRLRVLTVRLPALRERKADVTLLAAYFLSGIEPRKTFSQSALRKLEAYDWPGNVRELQNAVHRAALTSESDLILPSEIDLDVAAPPGEESFQAAKARAVEEFERAYVQNVLSACGGNISMAARKAGKERRALGRLVQKYRLTAFSRPA